MLKIKTNFIAKLLIVVLFAIIGYSILSEANASALTNESLYFKYNADGINYNVSGNSMLSKNNTQESAWNTIFTKYRGVIIGISGIATLTMVVLFILNFIKLGKSAGNPHERSQALSGLLWTGIAAAGAGGVTLFVGIFTNLLTD